MANSADPDQLASSEANWSGSTLFAKQSISGLSRTRVNDQSFNDTLTNDIIIFERWAQIYVICSRKGQVNKTCYVFDDNYRIFFFCNFSIKKNKHTLMMLIRSNPPRGWVGVLLTSTHNMLLFSLSLSPFLHLPYDLNNVKRDVKHQISICNICIFVDLGLTLEIHLCEEEIKTFFFSSEIIKHSWTSEKEPKA